MSSNKSSVGKERRVRPKMMAKNLCQRLLKFRWFHSKEAALVLVWTLLAVAGYRVSYKVMLFLIPAESFPIISSTGVSVVAAAPLIGWLTDAKLGNYKVVKIGITLSLLSSVLVSLVSLLNFNTPLEQNVTLKAVLLALISLIFWAGAFISFINSFQLSLEQIPDASAENIISLISWFAISSTTGYWVGDIVGDLLIDCVDKNYTDIVYQALTLFPVMCASVTFISFHLISPKWLIIEPKSPQSLKNIYRVLKFATKHKAPLNRSALTYWEEDIPSKLDLGKSRYGGPFTTEQVEDVKTFFRMLAVSVAIFLIVLASEIHEYSNFSNNIFINITNASMYCKADGLFLFTLHPAWCGVWTVLVYEFILYPCFNHGLPSSLKKIGISSFLVLLRNAMFLTVRILMNFKIVDSERATSWMMGVNSVLYGVLVMALGTPSIEFICAQAPYNMRGLMTGYILFTFGLAFVLGNLIEIKIFQYCHTSSCFLANASVGAALSIFSFLLYLIITHWYKRRVRDDIDTPHKWVEDVYDRYLSAAVNN